MSLEVSLQALSFAHGDTGIIVILRRGIDMEYLADLGVRLE
jgi:hypothetical protein